MVVTVCKWYNDAVSPFLFMIDDLANVWVDTNRSGTLDPGEDWGYWKNGKNSSFRFLNESILSLFPKVKVTFFVPVGVRAGMIANPRIPSISKAINCDDATKAFFRAIHHHPRFELAYHGTTHGQVGVRSEDFRQEWELFQSVAEATSAIEQGKAIFKDAVDADPLGGKYCGYAGNEFSDESINQTGFLWWCRYWNRGMDENDPGIGGGDTDPVSNYDVKYFGSRRVIDIPSTVNGALLNGLMRPAKTWKGLLKYLLRHRLIKRKLQQIDDLLANRSVISIQEHIAPSRDDGRIQGPNIFDDRDGLIYLFNYVSKIPVWYCTCSELAQYVRLRDCVEVISEGEQSFRLEGPYKEEHQQMISLKLSAASDCQIQLPNRKLVNVEDGLVNVPVMRGEYTIRPSRRVENEREHQHAKRSESRAVV